MVVTKLVDAADKVIGIASTERDITERKRAEEERERLLKSLEEKTKELEQVLYTASHDLRSPLVNIQGFAKELEQSLKQVRSLLQSKDISPEVREKLIVPLDKDIPDALQYIHASAYKIDTLLEGLLQLSRLGRAELDIKRLNMNKLMESVIQTFEFSIEERGVKLEVGDLPPCRGDETRINQLFSNLIDNAFKFLDPDRPGIIKINGKKEDKQAVYCVEDNGIGIAPEYHEKVFEIFERLNPTASTGEGLGLTIVRMIADRHNGKIWLESEPGKGSRFFVSLPAA
jgi:signal transduction histidine kinase